MQAIAVAESVQPNLPTAQPSCRCVPNQWEGILTSIEREFDTNKGGSVVMENRIKIHYDFLHKRFTMTDLTNLRRVVADFNRVCD